MTTIEDDSLVGPFEHEVVLVRHAEFALSAQQRLLADLPGRVSRLETKVLAPRQR